jgi:hypothetical protein
VNEPVKGTSVEDYVRPMRRYKGELVRDLAYGTVRLPAAWLRWGDLTVIALDAQARLDAGQASRLRVLLDQCAGLVDLIESLISGFISEQRSAGVTLTKNDLDSLRRGRGPGRVRDLLFQQLPAWPDGVGGDTARGVADVLRDCLRDRQSHLDAATRDPRDLRALIEPLLPEVQRLAADWCAYKRLSPSDTGYVVSEVIDQLIRTVAERNEAPASLPAWSRATAQWKWRTARPGPVDTGLRRELWVPGSGDVSDEVARRVDVHQRLREIASRLDDRAEWYGSLTPPRLDDALSCRAAALLVGTRQVELLEEIVRGLPEGTAAVRDVLAVLLVPLSPGRELAVIQVIRDMLRRHLGPGD